MKELLVTALVLAAQPAAAESRPARLFQLPTADVAGAYQLELAGDASLVTEPGVVSSAGVASLGFGDLAQLEYRLSSALDGQGASFTLPAIGVQAQLPLPRGPRRPRIGVALRLGLEREQAGVAVGDDGGSFQRISDLYAVASQRLGIVDLHAALRVAAASIEPAPGATVASARRTLWLPALGASARVRPDAEVVVEAALVPRLDPGDARPIGAAMFARAGTRWRLASWIAVDASVGYRIDVRRTEPIERSLLGWDLRLGGELTVPWGRLACRAVGVFCPDPPATKEAP